MVEADTREIHRDVVRNIMVTLIPQVKVGQDILSVKKMLKEEKILESTDYIYVVKDHVLQGTISLKDILHLPNDTKVEKVMKKDIITVHASTKKERAAYLALKHDLKEIPVVDKENHLLGVVPYDTILQIFNEEFHADILSLAGIHKRKGEELNVTTAPASKLIKARLPWLIVGLLGGMMAASVVGFFENTLSMYLTLALFIPVLVYMSDAIGTQSETLIIRSIALDPKLPVKSYLTREFKVVISLGIICSILLGIASLIWGTLLFAVIIGLSMFLGMLAAVFMATFLPLILKKIHLDPAIITGPLATVITDILTLAIYFGTASLLLTYFA